MATPSVADILDHHVTFSLEGIDRMYLNGYVPGLQSEGGVAHFLRKHRGAKMASSCLLEPISRDFAKAVDRFVDDHRIDVVRFEKGQRKDDVTKERLAAFTKREGVVYLGRAQEKMWTFRTEKRRNPKTGQTFPWLVRATAVVMQNYWYCVDDDFGPFFLKFGTYFPYPAKLCLNGHEYLKRQLTKEGIAFEALDNGILSCADPKRAQQIMDQLTSRKIEALFTRWLARLPQPFPAKDRAAGYQYQLSIFQAEFSLTQVFDRPLSGRRFFEQVITDNWTLGHPSQVQLIFDRRTTKKTPGQFRTRILSDGVIPSLHVDYKSTRIKQYYKEGRALRTETTINNTYDFNINRGLRHLPELREIGFAANRRLLSVQRACRDTIDGEDAFRRIHDPVKTATGETVVAGLRFGDYRVHRLMSQLIVLAVLPGVVRARQLRSRHGTLPALPGQCTPGRATYDLRRLRLHGLIERIPGKLAYTVTDFGLQAALFYTHAYDSLIAPGMADLSPNITAAPSPVRRAYEAFTRAWHQQTDSEIRRTA